MAHEGEMRWLDCCSLPVVVFSLYRGESSLRNVAKKSLCVEWHNSHGKSEDVFLRDAGGGPTRSLLEFTDLAFRNVCSISRAGNSDKRYSNQE